MIEIAQGATTIRCHGSGLSLVSDFSDPKEGPATEIQGEKFISVMDPSGVAVHSVIGVSQPGIVFYSKSNPDSLRPRGVLTIHEPALGREVAHGTFIDAGGNKTPVSCQQY